MSAARPFEGCLSENADAWAKASLTNGCILTHAMITVINRQRSRKIQTQTWQRFVTRALPHISAATRSVTIVFVGDAPIRRLNRDFRGRDQVTDVLSFPHEAEPFENAVELGEIVISIPRAAAQAKENGLTFSNEVEQLILHGLLHLAGYDHETDRGEMNRLELKLRTKLGI